MQYSIQVLKPCHESWDDMTQAQSGRYCAQCAKTVQDFTGWGSDEILQYLQQSSTEVCGRFQATQLNVPADADMFIRSVANARVPLYKKIAAIFLLSFGLIQISHNANAQHVTGHIAASRDTPGTHHGHIMGGATPYREPETPTPQKNPPANRMPKPERHYLQGEVCVKPHPKHANVKTQKKPHIAGKVNTTSPVSTAYKNKKD